MKKDTIKDLRKLKKQELLDRLIKAETRLKFVDRITTIVVCSIAGIGVVFLETLALSHGIDGIALSISLGILFFLVGLMINREGMFIRLIKLFRRDKDG